MPFIKPFSVNSFSFWNILMYKNRSRGNDVMNKKTKIVLIIAILLLITGMAFNSEIKGWFVKEGESAPIVSSGNASASRALNVSAQILRYETLKDVLPSIPGTLIPDEEVDLSFETSGKITSIHFKEGSHITKGELLAKVNDKPLQAELKKLEAQLPLAEGRVFRQKTLLEKDAVSQEAFESVSTELEKLKADIELVRTRIAQTELRAPFDGIIGLRQVSEGTYASPTTIIARLTKINPLKVEFSVIEKQAGNIKAGTPIYFYVDNSDLNRYHAKVYALESNLTKETYNMKVRALYPNPGGHLQPGRSVKIDIELQEIENAIVIPGISSLAEMGRDIVYVYKNGKAHQVEIKKGMRTASSVQVLDGLSPGDTLLVTGVMQLRDGMPVAIDRFVESNQ